MGASLAVGTGSSVVVERCQICESPELAPVLFLGYLPPVNQFRDIGASPVEQPAYPAQVLQCARCQLVQLGLVVDPKILFPPEYPYTSGTTRLLRDNFANLYEECRKLFDLKPDDLVVDIGSNDGTLLSNFAGKHRVLGIEPTATGSLAQERGIPTLISFFNQDVARRVRASEGTARVVTATNVFAHMEDIHSVVDGIASLLADDGVFISESHYLVDLVTELQYDTIYHEHLRYYSLQSLRYLLEMHGLTVVHARRIPTHGGSIRVYAVKSRHHQVQASVQEILEEERWSLDVEAMRRFRRRVVCSKLQLLALLSDIVARGKRIYGVGAPSRAATLINYVGVDDGMIDCVLEIKGSRKIGKYLPGTLIPVIEESRLLEEPPDHALLFSWHIADELVEKLTSRGYRGDFIIPLPTPRILPRRS